MYEFCRFRFDPENHSLESDGRPIALTPKAFEILQVLVQNGNRLTSKEELMRRVWPDSFVEEANLTVNISVLRRQLGEAPDGQQYIETVPTKGYRFNATVAAASEQASVNVQTVAASTEEMSASIAEIRTAYETTELKAKLARWHKHVDNAFYGWNDAWLDPTFRAWDISEVLAYIRVPVAILQGADHLQPGAVADMA